MRRRLVISLAVVAILAACPCAYYCMLPVKLILEPRDGDTAGRGPVAGVRVSAVLRAGFRFNAADIVHYRVEPAGIAEVRPSVDGSVLEVIYLKAGEGTLTVSLGDVSESVEISLPARVSSKVKEERSALGKLYDRHRHVEMVYLRDGSVLKGVIHSRGEVVRLITPGGRLNLSAAEVVKVEYLKADAL